MAFACLLLCLLCLPGTVLSTHALEEEDQAYVDKARAALQDILAENGNHQILALVYLEDYYPIRAQIGEDARELISVPSGQTVTILDVFLDEDYTVWCYVSTYVGETLYTGYIPRHYLATSDELYLNWEEEWGMADNSGVMLMSLDTTYEDIAQFPESYQEALLALKEAHPNWTFVKMNVDVSWDTVITNELKGSRSLVYKTYAAYCKEAAYDSGSWYYASEDILEYYMDPRNFLTEKYIFQFEQLTYNASYHKQEAVTAILKNTFMSSDLGTAPGSNSTYAEIIWDVAVSLNVSPFHLAARIYQEQGSGTSALISGTYTGYEGYYNYFNIGATGTTTTAVIESGLAYAKSKGWNSVEASIAGGASSISTNYILKGQDTLYLQKYNVNADGYYSLYTHQYMQNIAAPSAEAKTIYALYEEAEALEGTFVFKIPVYNDMPDTACAYPTSSTDVILTLPDGYTGTTVWLDGVAYSATSRNGYLVVKAGTTDKTTAVVYLYDDSSVPTGMYLWTLSYQNNCYTVTAQPDLEDLLSYHGFSIRISGNSGIRFKTGISTSLRAQLLSSSGVNGYTLVEYGTLVMNNDNLASYPMVLGGEKVLSGVSYGVDSSGTLTDNIFETVSNRYRYTSVLIGIPASSYKTSYAFRGYIILEKDGKQITVYGPIVAKSIYTMAEQLLAKGSYSSGSDEAQFLQQIIKDAG